MPAFDLQKPKSWPKDLHSFLVKHTPFYRDWFKDRELGALSYEESVALGGRYDSLYEELESILAPLHLTAYHCTRLTELEIQEVVANGLLPSSPELLERRIRRLPISRNIQDRLCSENQATERYRSGMIWFCLFPPIQESHGVQRFFRSWGGEALYNSHESDPETGAILRQIGIPCVVAVRLPIASMAQRIWVGGLLKLYFGVESAPIRGEDHAASPIVASAILKIYKHPSTAFIKLTGWDNACLEE